LEQHGVAGCTAPELHHCPTAAENGLAAAGHHNPKLINAQIPELQVRVEQITHRSHLVAD
jgi:hypothetical protein